jgi:hypothetical protein
MTKFSFEIFNLLSLMRSRYRVADLARRHFAIFGCFFLLGCDQQSLPTYWLCDGSSNQQVTVMNKSTVSYQGTGPIILEVFLNHVYQNSPSAFAGTYIQCPSEHDKILFRATDCQEKNNQQNFREGTLNKTSGELTFVDYRQVNGIKVAGNGQYSCRYTGHTFEFIYEKK